METIMEFFNPPKKVNVSLKKCIQLNTYIVEDRIGFYENYNVKGFKYLKNAIKEYRKKVNQYINLKV